MTHRPSIKRDDIYDALRRKGYSKEKSARIANSRSGGMKRVKQVKRK
jgi:hypothetical protein